jgi:hypothetical protein
MAKEEKCAGCRGYGECAGCDEGAGCEEQNPPLDDLVYRIPAPKIKSKPIKVHRIKVTNRPRSKGKVSNGSITLLYLDGKPIHGATSFKYEVDACSIGKVTIELFASVEIDATLPEGRIIVKTKEY